MYKLFLVKLRVLIALAVRNFVLHRIKTLIIGTIMFFGTFLFVIGTAMLDSLERTMSKSITSSLAGHLQVYSKSAKDELALFGGVMMGAEDIGTIDEFSSVKTAAMGVPNVKAVVPMGIDMLTVGTGNELDKALEQLREAVKGGDKARIADRVSRLRSMADALEDELKTKLAVVEDREKVEKQLLDVEKIRGDAFWAEFDADPEKSLIYLDSKIAPLSEGGFQTYLRTVGTDLQAFKQNFDRFEIVKGQMVPEGKRGFLFNEKVYEEEIKHVVARELDAILRAVTVDKKSIAGDSALASRAKQMARAYHAITFQTSPADAKEIETKLRAILPSVQGGQVELLKAFLTVDDANIRERHKQFYEIIAPKIRLYEFDVGDVMTVRAYTKSGYINSANVRVYGTYKFKGLERADLAGGHNLIDLVTFRELYGKMTAAQKSELESIKSAFGAKQVSREDAEAAFFGSADSFVADDTPKAAEGGEKSGALAAAEALKGGADKLKAEDTPYTQQDVDTGLALNAAVILDDPTRIEETQAALGKAVDPLGLKVVDWQAASGLLGQMIVVIRGVLYVAIIIIFLVALVIINNSLVMAMQDRIAEIGTMRAIGAQARFVLGLFLGETVLLGIIAGAIGALFATGVVLLLGSRGIPAFVDALVFVFGGPRFYPTIGVGNVAFGMALILIIGFASTLYPAKMATEIQPVVAMRGKQA